MKKLFAYAATIAALFAAVSCSNKELEPTSEVVGETVNIRISSKSAGETKTGVVYNTEDKKHSPYWNKGDEIGVFFDEFTDKAKPDAILANTNEDKSQEAVFSAEDVTLNNGTVPGDDGNVYSFYPASAFQSGSVGDKSVRVDVKSTQTPAAVDTYDPQADILVGQPSEYLFDASNNTFVADIAFARVMSVVKISLIAGTECPKDLAVNKLTMAAPEGSILTGRVTLSLAALYGDDSPLGKWTVGNGEVSAVYTEDKPVIGGEANTVYVIVNPTSIESGDIVFTIDTDDYSIEKTVTLTKALVFPQSKVANIDLTIAGTNCEKKVAETRIWVDNFGKCTVNKTKYEVSQTGAKGTGLNENTSYDYGTGDIRINSNGHSNSDPYLYVPGSNTFTVKNLFVSEETALILSAQTKNAGTVTLKCKESAAEEWTEIGSWTSTGSFSEQKTIFNIASTATSIDLSFTASASIIIDDIVLEKFVDQRTQLNVPANVKAEADATTSNKVNVTWDAVENAGSYEVTLQTSGEEDVVETVETNSISFTGLKYSTQYSVKVKAISSDVSLYKDSEYSEPVNVTTGAKPAVQIDWVKKSFADLAAGDEVVIVKTSDTPYAMSNDQGTSAPPTAVAVSVSNDKLGAEPEANIIWYVGIDGSNKIFNKDKEGSAWLYCTSTNNGVRVGTNTAKTFTWDDKEYLKHVGTSRYLGVYNDQDWRCYSTAEPSTHTNLKDQAFAFFVKNDPRTALATPEINVTPNNTAKKITVTWGAVDNAANYTVTCTGQTDQTVTETSCEFTGLAYGDYTVTVQANPAAGSTAYRSSGKASKNVSIVDTTPVINASNPAAVEATATSVEVSYTVTNKVEGTNLTAAVTSGDWISNPQVASDKVTFTLAQNTTSEQRTGTVTLSYAGAENKVVTITQKGAGQVGYASLEDLVAAGEPKSGKDAENVTVTFSNKKIIEIQGNRKGIWLSVAGAPNDKIEIYPNVVMPEDWVVGGIVTATLTNCKWVKYNDSTWELCPTDWSEISYIGPCATPEITLDGANATITCATAGATILYEISDTEPASFTHTYSSAVALEDGQTIWAKATLAGYPDSKVASKKYTAGGVETKTFKITSGDVVSNSGYAKYETTVDNRGWIITFGGNNKSVGTNSNNRSKCNLSSYSKYAVSPVTTSDVASAFACKTKLTGVKEISYTFNGGSSQTSTNVYVIYSKDGNTFSQISLISGTQGAAISSGTTYKFNACDGYFALLFKATNSSGNWRIDDVEIEFTYEE